MSYGLRPNLFLCFSRPSSVWPQVPPWSPTPVCSSGSQYEVPWRVFGNAWKYQDCHKDRDGDWHLVGRVHACKLPSNGTPTVPHSKQLSQPYVSCAPVEKCCLILAKLVHSSSFKPVMCVCPCYFIPPGISLLSSWLIWVLSVCKDCLAWISSWSHHTFWTLKLTTKYHSEADRVMWGM